MIRIDWYHLSAVVTTVGTVGPEVPLSLVAKNEDAATLLFDEWEGLRKGKTPLPQCETAAAFCAWAVGRHPELLVYGGRV